MNENIEQSLGDIWSTISVLTQYYENSTRRRDKERSRQNFKEIMAEILLNLMNLRTSKILNRINFSNPY